MGRVRYNFKRLTGSEWYDLLTNLKSRGTTLLEVDSHELFKPWITKKVYCAYFSRTRSSCRIIYYDFEDGRYRKRLREISFSPKKIDVLKCVKTFDRIARKNKEYLGYEPEERPYTNGVYTYFNGYYKGKTTVLDMNSAYLHALRQPLANWRTKTKCTLEDVALEKYDFYLFENSMHKEMIYKKDHKGIYAASMWAGVEIYGFKGKYHFSKTAKELYKLKQKDDLELYKNVANVRIGCFHKKSAENNNRTLAASLYAWFAWYIDYLVDRFEKAGYEVIMVTTDSIKIKGDYKKSDRIVKLGKGLGEFMIEYVGEGVYYKEGHYEEDVVKWKGKPEYMRDGTGMLKFVENLEEEKDIYENFAKTKE